MRTAKIFIMLVFYAFIFYSGIVLYPLLQVGYGKLFGMFMVFAPLIMLIVAYQFVYKGAEIILGLFVKLAPQNGDRIEITWLPNPPNHPYSKNCYIGAIGTVEDYTAEGFNLRLDSGASLIVNKKYSFKMAD